jgi:hypothetical protein
MEQDTLVELLKTNTELLRKQQEEIIKLRYDITALQYKRNEKYYQKFLEKELGGGHQATKFGITDISTDTYHLEIKHWSNFKACLGQLQAYNHNDDKRLVAAFFGDIASSKKHDVIQLFYDNRIEVWELCEFNHEVKILKHKVEGENLFMEFLHKHLRYSPGSQINLKTILDLFFGQPLPSRKACVYRQQVESYIKKRFPKASWKYSDTTFNSKRFRGWCDIEFKSE